jgi:hypothetical protein
MVITTYVNTYTVRDYFNNCSEQPFPSQRPRRDHVEQTKSSYSTGVVGQLLFSYGRPYMYGRKAK